MIENTPIPDNRTDPIVVFVRMSNALLRQGMVQTIERIPNTRVLAGCIGEYREFCGMQRVTVDLLVADAFSANDFLRKLQRHRCQLPVRTLLVAFGKAPLLLDILSDRSVCGWMDIDQPFDRIQSVIHKAVNCDHSQDARCQGCAVRRSDSTLEQFLSPKELAIFAMISEGIGPDEIASKLGLSTKTVETHRARIKHKLGLRHRQDLVVAAVTWRIGLFEKTTQLINLLRDKETSKEDRPGVEQGNGS